MSRKTGIYLTLGLLVISALQGFSQIAQIGGIINEYTPIVSIYSADANNVDTLAVGDASLFDVGDTVMVYCVKGATIGTAHDSTYLPGNNVYDPGMDAQNPRNTGKYAFFLVSEVIGDTVVLNASLNPEILPMAIGEMAQLIRVRSYRYANVTGTGLSAPSWNPATGTGGVITLFVHGVLRLDADIDVSADGFKGALGNTDAIYTAGCSSTDTLNYYEPFYLNGELYAGLKGEGTTDTSFPYIRGKASNINGGGGGNGLLAGGGGGSNYSAGVRGGSESTACPPGVDITGGS